MQEAIKALRQLQEVDRDLFRLRAELRRLPRELEEARRRIDKLRERHAALTARAGELRTRIKEIEHDTTLQRQRMRKVESEALKSRGDVALQAAFQHEARSLKREISSSEEEGLRFLEECEGTEAQAATIESEIEAEEQTFEALAANIQAEIEVASGRRDGLETERAQRMSDSVDPEVLSTYQRLLEVRDGQALAVLDKRICQECWMEAPPNLYVRVARGVELVQCPNCDRFLYLPE